MSIVLVDLAGAGRISCVEEVGVNSPPNKNLKGTSLLVQFVEIGAPLRTQESWILLQDVRPLCGVV